jgi:hypothetical protein
MKKFDFTKVLASAIDDLPMGIEPPDEKIRLIVRPPYTCVELRRGKKLRAYGFAKCRPGPKGDKFSAAAGARKAFSRAFADYLRLARNGATPL